jgi:hypothetical protein
LDAEGRTEIDSRRREERKKKCEQLVELVRRKIVKERKAIAQKITQRQRERQTTAKLRPKICEKVSLQGTGDGPVETGPA